MVAIGFVGNEDYIGTIGTEKFTDLPEPAQEAKATEEPEPEVPQERQVVNIWFFGNPNHEHEHHHGHHRNQKMIEGKPVGIIQI